MSTTTIDRAPHASAPSSTARLDHLVQTPYRVRRRAAGRTAPVLHPDRAPGRGPRRPGREPFSARSRVRAQSCAVPRPAASTAPHDRLLGVLVIGLLTMFAAAVFVVVHGFWGVASDPAAHDMPADGPAAVARR